MMNMGTVTPRLLVWTPADHRLLGIAPTQAPYVVLGDKYARALRLCADAQAVVFPLAEPHDIDALLPLVDGVMLTGSPSNVHPSRFDEAVADPSLPLDPVRDALTLALVGACVAQAVPLLGICRGFQEMNVALGGSLLQQVHRTPGLADHRERENLPLADQYGQAHAIRLQPGSLLAQFAGGTTAQVNSLHGQGIGRLATGLEAVAWAPDGLVEGVTVRGARVFALGVQWHPEWQCEQQAFSRGIFQAFGQACAVRKSARQHNNKERA
jgi:putative glutamine amidotransferase